jgi:hypothetical protein
VIVGIKFPAPMRQNRLPSENGLELEPFRKNGDGHLMAAT